MVQTDITLITAGRMKNGKNQTDPVVARTPFSLSLSLSFSLTHTHTHSLKSKLKNKSCIYGTDSHTW
jgi:hypothetical protein